MRNTFKIIPVISLLFLAADTFAQGGPGFEDGVPDAVPIDGAVWLLMAFGLTYAIRTIQKRSHKGENNRDIRL